MTERNYVIRVTVPFSKLDNAMRDGLFTAVSDAVFDWEPEERDGWDADISSGIEEADEEGT